MLLERKIVIIWRSIWIFRYAKQTNNLIYQSCTTAQLSDVYTALRSTWLWFESYILHTWGLKKVSFSCFLPNIIHQGVSQNFFFQGTILYGLPKQFQAWIYLFTFLIDMLFAPVSCSAHGFTNSQSRISNFLLICCCCFSSNQTDHGYHSGISVSGNKIK